MVKTKLASPDANTVVVKYAVAPASVVVMQTIMHWNVSKMQFYFALFPEFLACIY